MTEKVVGTSYVKQPEFSTIAGRLIPSNKNRFGIDLMYTTAHLVSEPTNPYDATAVAVYVHDTNGNDHRIGYIPKYSELKSHLTGDDKNKKLNNGGDKHETETIISCKNNT